MSSSILLLGSPSQRHHLSPVKPMKSNRVRGTNSLLNRDSYPYPAVNVSKRHLTDENTHPLQQASPLFMSPTTKRSKTLETKTTTTIKAIQRSFGTEISNVAPGSKSKSATLIKKSPGSGSGIGGGALSEKLHQAATKSVTKSLRGITKPGATTTASKKISPTRISPRRSIARRSKRIDPPSFSPRSSSPASIDALLSAAITRPKPTVAPLAAACESLNDATDIRESWSFSIYEDSAEETLQNLMEHSTHTLYISDESDDDGSELQELGKENIAPERMAELLSVPAGDRANSMRLDRQPRPERPMRRQGVREALREMAEDELESIGLIPKKTVGAGQYEFTMEFKTPQKKKPSPLSSELLKTPSTPGSPGCVLDWSSEPEEDREREGSPSPDRRQEGVFEVSPFEIDSASLDGSEASEASEASN
ncbi:hypothetical protein BZA77DRAFT_129579 [Pyronema omphalodes]|nr:hypothetical protein BZA77DRAFT_129579 [Pyronema omphalodes]